MARIKTETVQLKVTLTGPLAELYTEASKLGIYGATPAEVMRYMLTHVAETHPVLSRLTQQRVDALLDKK